jgi:hypothetical protein
MKVTRAGKDGAGAASEEGADETAGVASEDGPDETAAAGAAQREQTRAESV